MQIVLDVLPINGLLAFIIAIAAMVVFMLTRKPPMKKLLACFAATFLAAVYIFMACSILFSTTRFGIYGDPSPFSGNYVPFKTISAYANRGNFIIFTKQVIGNILITLPFPFVVWFYSRKRKMKRIGWVSLIITATIEPLQILINLFLGGPSNIIDVDDLILNLVGCTLGLLLLKGVSNFCKPKTNTTFDGAP